MANDDKFGIFLQDGDGPLCREFFGDVGEAMRQAQQLAAEDGLEHFVFNFESYSEVARFIPSRVRSSAKTLAW